MAPILETLPPKKSQDPRVPRRLVYLDQNVVTNIAKVRLGRELPEALRDASNDLYAAIKTSVLEKQSAICVESIFHRTESSGLVTWAREDRKSDAFKLFHEISQFITYYSYTLHLSTCGELQEVQTVVAVATKLGLVGPDRRPYNWRAALSRDPHSSHERDGRVVEFGGYKFVIGAEWKPQTVVDGPWAAHVTQLRSEGAYADFNATMERLKGYQRGDAVRANEFNSWADRWGHPAFNEMPRAAVDEFIQSDAFFDIPVLYASRELYAHVLSERTRAYRDSDPNDIDILAASIPYCDLVVTDKYMAEAANQLGLGTAFNTTIVAATPDGLRHAAEFLDRDEPAPSGSATAE